MSVPQSLEFGRGPLSRRRRWTLLLPLLLSACALQQASVEKMPVSPEIVRTSVRFNKEYLLFAGDQIEVSVWRTPEVSRTVVIRADGYISLPLVQDIKAAGLTSRELAVKIREALMQRFRKPEVTVIPVAVRQPTVYVLGDVRNPGAYPIRNAVTAAQAIAAAGGTLRSAADDSVAVIRLSDEGYLEAIPIQSGSSLRQPDPFIAMAATPLNADDIVFVPETGRSQVIRMLQDFLVPLQIYLNYKLIDRVL